VIDSQTAACARADVTIVTHSALPGGALDDQLLATSLRRYGLSVRFAVWNDPEPDWTVSPLTVIRSTWDYYRHQREWKFWLEIVRSKTSLQNSVDIVLRNSDKRYLTDLSALGINHIPTVFIDQSSQVSLVEICKQSDWQDVVVKPSVAASAFGAARFSGERIETAGEAHLQLLTNSGGALVQPYLSSIETSLERSLVFVSGKFVHAYTKRAFNANSSGTTSIQRYNATSQEINFALSAIAVFVGETLYARVDLLPDAAGHVLMELELIEPDLALRFFPATADFLACSCRQLVRRLRD
jgi:hypothetical protein